MSGVWRMNEKEMMAAIYEHAYLDPHRDNASYVMTEAEERRFQRAVRKCYDRIWKLAAAHLDHEIYDKIYGE